MPSFPADLPSSRRALKLDEASPAEENTEFTGRRAENRHVDHKHRHPNDRLIIFPIITLNGYMHNRCSLGMIKIDKQVPI